MKEKASIPVPGIQPKNVRHGSGKKKNKNLSGSLKKERKETSKVIERKLKDEVKGHSTYTHSLVVNSSDFKRLLGTIARQVTLLHFKLTFRAQDGKHRMYSCCSCSQDSPNVSIDSCKASVKAVTFHKYI